MARLSRSDTGYPQGASVGIIRRRPMNLSAVILAAGESRRMGKDKAWVEIGGQPLIVRALHTVANAGIEEIFISGRPSVDYSSLGHPVLLDREPGQGPLSGIERALETASAPLVLVLAVDLPGMTSAFLRKLAAHCDPLTGAIPQLQSGLEPLVAIYPKRCLGIAREALAKGRLAARDFAASCLHEQTVRIFTVELPDAACFENWNTPSQVKQ